MFQKFQKTIWLLPILFIISACGVVTPPDTPQNSNNFIEQEFTNKIIYKQSADLEKIQIDCGNREGVFNACGSPCAPDAEMCVKMCAHTCELSPSITKKEASEKTIKTGKDKTGLGLTVAHNVSIEIFAQNLSGARDLVGPDAFGNYWLSRTSEGIITQLTVTPEGVEQQADIFRNLRKPHGLALSNDGLTLFIAEEDKLSKVALYSDGSMEKLVDLPIGGRHTTRSLLIGPDEKLYISIGSSCDTCYEKDEKRGTVYSLNQDGTDFKVFATGLRNSVFLTTNYVTGDIWATEMGRDFLGDNLPPDEVNILKEGEDYGWPLCYGQNVHDTVFDSNQYIQDPCTNKIPAHIELQAHSAPLGLAFIPEEGWPEDWWYNLLVAYHGSWDRSEATGYKIMRIILDAEGNILGREDFISGWLTDDGSVIGRPVDLLIQPGGILFITDDKKGVIYRVLYQNPIAF